MITSAHKHQLSTGFSHLQDDIIQALEAFEPIHRFKRSQWKRSEISEEGGGVMAVLEGGDVFERAGVNISTVYGVFAPEFQKEIPGAEQDPHFWASGLSLVLHPRNPYVPSVHMNTRCLATTHHWFGGGADLTPAIVFEEDVDWFHSHLKTVCDNFDPTYYPTFKKACDTYFFLPHRQEARGVGGIFYDNFDSGSEEKDIAFTQAVGRSFKQYYLPLVERRFSMPWGDQEKAIQLKKRGRYVEFNLLYDRGTRFGLMTGGNIDSIFVSLPPLVSWSSQ